MAKLLVARPGRLQLRAGSPGAVATLCAGVAVAAMVSASAVSPKPSNPRSEPIVPAGKSVQASPRLTHAHLSTARVSSAMLESVAGFVAKKYRVSEAAAREFVALAEREALRHGLDPLLVVAVIGIESRFNPVAQSEAGAVGLMQVIPRFHGDKIAAAGGGSILDPGHNIAVGARILKESIRRGGTEADGLQLYNGAAEDPTSAYAKRVQAERQRLQDVVRRTQGRA